MSEAWIDVEHGDVQAQSHGLARQPDGRYILVSPSHDGEVEHRSPQDEDHEADLRAARNAYYDIPRDAEVPAYASLEAFDRAIVAYLSRVARSRDGSVAVEDVRNFAARWIRTVVGDQAAKNFVRELADEFSPASTGGRPLSE